MPEFDRIVFATAAPAETAAVLRGLGVSIVAARGRLVPARPGFLVLETGVSKAAAAATVAAALRDQGPGTAVVNIGIAGTLSDGVPLGAVVLADRCVFADDGVQTPERFMSCAEVGFPIGPGGVDWVTPDERLVARLASVATHRGPIATVSTCSGTDALRDAVVARTGAIAEAMEGAAAGLAAAALGLPFAELRVISNTTGDRAAQVWRIGDALSRLEEVVRGLTL